MRRFAALATVIVWLLVALPMPAGAASDAPQLPRASGSDCVPGSPVVVDGPPWAQQWLTPDRAWALTRGRGVTVAVVDGGVGSPAALAGAVRGGGRDCTGHGTLLASLVAARPVARVGFVGIAAEASILSIPVPTGTVGSGPRLTTPDALAGALRAAVAGGAKVVLVGATATGPSSALAAAVKAAVRADVLVVSGVGTLASTSDSRLAESYPSAYPDVLGVAAMRLDGTVATFSAISDDVDLTAPGVGVVGAGPTGRGHYSTDGTAVAAAFVAGTAALVRSYRPDLTATEVARRLELTAVPSSSGTQSSLSGYGVVDPTAAVTAELPASAGQTAQPVTVVSVKADRPAVADPGATRIALLVTAIVVVGGLLGVVIGAILRLGRARRVT